MFLRCVRRGAVVRVLLGVIFGLVFGKPIGILLVSWLAIKSRVGTPPSHMNRRVFIGAACLCGAGYTVSLLMVDQAFSHSNFAAVAKIGVLVGSALAGAVGAVILISGKRQGIE